MSNDVKLEPCPAPWCDKDEPDVEVTGYRGMEFVVCGNCGCTGPESNSPAEAIAAWNTRTAAQPEREFQEGDKVHKASGYRWPGEVVAVFKTRAGKTRIVVECTVPEVAGALHIYSPEQLELEG